MKRPENLLVSLENKLQVVITVAIFAPAFFKDISSGHTSWYFWYCSAALDLFAYFLLQAFRNHVFSNSQLSWLNAFTLAGIGSFIVPVGFFSFIYNMKEVPGYFAYFGLYASLIFIFASFVFSVTVLFLLSFYRLTGTRLPNKA